MCTLATKSEVEISMPADDHSDRHAGPARLASFWVVLAGVFNVVARIPFPLRLPFSPYYVSAPFVGFFLFLSSPGFRLRLVYFSVVMVWAWFAGYLFGTSITVMASQSLFMLFALISIETIVNWSIKSPNFPIESERIFDLISALVILLFIIQTILDFDFPGTGGYRRYKMSTSLFFTPNDMALFLSVYILLIISGKKPIIIKCAVCFLILAINKYNDANLALASNAIAISIAIFLRIFRQFRFPLIWLIFFVSIPAAFIPLTVVKFGRNSAGNIFEAIWRIFTLNRFHLKGSIYDRTDALIIGVTEFGKSNFLGLGPGGSVQALSKEGNLLYSAKSLHNGLAELFFELGPVFILPFMIIVSINVIRLIGRPRLSKEDAAVFTLIVSLPLMAMVQSAGFMSNYAFWTCAATVWARSRVVSGANWMPQKISPSADFHDSIGPA